MPQDTRKKMKVSKNSEGFTLIEVMIALVIFSFGILGLYAVQISAINGNTNARKQTEAVSWATNQLEILLKTPYASLGNDQITQGIYTIQCTAPEIDINGDGDGDARNIQVNVSWVDSRGPKNTTVSFIKLEE